MRVISETLGRDISSTKYRHNYSEGPISVRVWHIQCDELSDFARWHSGCIQNDRLYKKLLPTKPNMTMSNMLLHTPARHLRILHRELDRTVANIFPSFGFVDTRAWNDFARDFSPKLDVVETDKSFLIEFDVPGVEKEDIEINVHEGILTIRGERKAREIEETETRIRAERVTGSFSRAFHLPSEIKEKKISARMENGVLYVELPKAEEIKPHSIKIS